MRIVTVDFETYYADDYSLSSMQTDAYILDPRFEVIGVGVKVDSAPTDWFSGTRAEVYNWLHAIDWSDSAILAHHTQFDGFILTQHFDIRPKLWLDTLSMFRALYPYLPSASLAAMSAHLRLGAKGNEVVQAKNKCRTDFSSEELAAYGSYCRNDVELTYAAFKQMLHGVPAQEMSIIDMNVRMFVEPILQLDVPKLTEYRDTILATKRQLQEDSGFARDVLMSNDKFAEALRHFGIDPPMKVSKRTGKSAYAFAKTDEDFVDLLEYPDSRVQALVAARLGNKSTIAETRAEPRERVPDLPELLGGEGYWSRQRGEFDQHTEPPFPRERQGAARSDRRSARFCDSCWGLFQHRASRQPHDVRAHGLPRPHPDVRYSRGRGDERPVL